MDVVLRASAIFLMLFVLLRVMGKRQLGQMTPFEFVGLVVLGDFVQQAVTHNDYSITAATLAVTTPDRLRNGMLFETRISAQAKRPIEDAVIAIPSAMWRDMTVNTMVPAPAEEEFVAGEFRFHFGPLEPGETLTLKVDGQVNPPRYSSSSGRLRLLDGEAELAVLPLSLKVIP